MKLRSIVLMSLLVAGLHGSEYELLSDEKQKLLQEQKNEYEQQSKLYEYDYISPLNLGASYGYDRSTTHQSSSSSRASASISQDIFRSGGIDAQIGYAKAFKSSSEFKLKQDIADLNYSTYSALISYKRLELQKLQSEIKLANHDIEVFIKQKLYEAGKSDITELNNALMLRINQQKSDLDLKKSLSTLKEELRKISDADPDNFELVGFELIPKESFVGDNFAIKYDESQSRVYEEQLHLTQSKYLPRIYVDASGGYMKNHTPSDAKSRDGSYYSAGAGVSMPLSYTASYDKEVKKIALLKQKYLVDDEKRALNSEYEIALLEMQNYKEQIEVIEKNMALYDDLIVALDAEVASGSKSKYDLQTIVNTKKIEQINIDLNRLDVELLLAKLYFSSNTHKER